MKNIKLNRGTIMKQYKKPIILLVGASGSGKNTIQDIMIQKHGLKPLLSYTTRNKRYPEEQTHTFITEKEYNHIKETEKIIAYTYYQNNHYFATEQQLEEADIYIIDIEGIKYLKEHSDLPYIVFYLDVSELERIHRMRHRGDSTQQIQERLKIDRKVFKNNNNLYDYVIENIDCQETADTIYRLWEYEIYEYNKKITNAIQSHSKSNSQRNKYSDTLQNTKHLNPQEVIDTERQIIDHIYQIQTLMLQLQTQIEHIEISVYDTKYGSISNNIEVFGCNYEYETDAIPTSNISFKTYTDQDSQKSYLQNNIGYKNIYNIRIE